MSRLGASIVSLLLAAAVVAPVVRGPDRDGFPISSYPMFSHRLDQEVQISTVMGVEGSGDLRILSPGLIADTTEVIIAHGTVNDAVGRGRAGAEDLCSTVATRVAAAGTADVTSVRVVTNRYDAVKYWAGDREAQATTVHAECPVIGP